MALKIVKIIPLDFKEFFSMKKLSHLIAFAIFITVIPKAVNAQLYFMNDDYYYTPITFEFGGSVGAMNCLTDLGGKQGVGKQFVKDINFGNSNACVGGYFTTMYKSAFGIRLEANFGKVSAYDSILKGVPKSDIASNRFNRNLNFQSPITEYSCIAEIHPLYIFINYGLRDQAPPKFSPFILGGFGSFSFNPQADINGRKIDLQPLSTEGQGFKQYPDRAVYKLKQTNIPVGLGFRYDISPTFKLRGEMVYRILSTDYLDDVSKTYIDPNLFDLNGLTDAQIYDAKLLYSNANNGFPGVGPGKRRGNPTNNDSYFSFNLKVGFVIGTQRIRD